MIALLVALCASIVGAISGIGGGVIIKPLLDLSGNYSTAAISILSSATVFSMSASALFKHYRLHTKFDIKFASYIAISSMIGGLLGQSLLSSLLKFDNIPIKQIQNLVLMILLIIVLIYMNKFKEKYHWHLKSPVAPILVGIFFGFLSAFLGIGGGPINLVALTLFFSMNTKAASVISVFMIFFSQASKLSQVLLTQSYVGLDLTALLYMIPAGIIGGLIGSKLNHQFTEKQIHNLFNIVLCFVIVTTAINLF